MKRDFSIELIGLSGAKLLDRIQIDRENFEDRPMTSGSVSVNSLMGQYADEQGLSGEEKFKRYQLAQRISGGGVQDVTAEEVSLLKRLIGKNYPPIVVGPSYLALEAEPESAPAA